MMIENEAALTQQITHGVYVIGVRAGELKNAFTASWVMQVSFQPLRLAFAINPEHYSYHLLKQGGVCSVNVLRHEQLEIAEHFGRPMKEKMRGYEWRQGATGAPILLDASAYFDCKVRDCRNAGDHEVVVCDVIEADFLQPGQLMLYSDTGDMDGGCENY